MALPNADAPRPPSGWTRAHRSALAAHAFTAAAFAVWWAYAQIVPVYQVPGPFAVAAKMMQIASTPVLVLQLATSVAHVLASIAIAFVAGSLLAAVSAYASATRLLIDGVVTPFLNAFAGIGWLFLALLWFGLNSATVIFAVTLILVPFVTINIRTGFREADLDLRELGRSLTRNRFRHEFLIVLPQLVPYVFAALRTCFGVAWKVVLVSELFGGSAGAGYMLNVARQEFDTETIFAVIAFIIIFVWTSERILFRPLQSRIDRRFDRA
jgi:NitT/TauT family transport system permease protein